MTCWLLSRRKGIVCDIVSALGAGHELRQSNPSHSGYVKVAWNFRLPADSPKGTILSTGTRIKCIGSAAFWKSRVYWSLVGPFSCLMRTRLLSG
jgi:hypothetical protein